MTRSIRRHLRFLHAYVAVTLLGGTALAVSGFGQPSAPKNLGEITVERINVVDANGTLRMVISNKDRMHPGVIGGIVMRRPRPYAGLIFFNDQGDEAGGLSLAGRDQAGSRTAEANLAFDQLGQDQTIGFHYTELNGRRSAGVTVWDRPDAPLSEVIEKVNAANALPTQAERDAAVAQVQAAVPTSAQRVFVGKTRERDATVVLADAQGRNRLTLKVDAAGHASIEFLDADGKVVQRLAPDR